MEKYKAEELTKDKIKKKIKSQIDAKTVKGPITNFTRPWRHSVSRKRRRQKKKSRERRGREQRLERRDQESKEKN